MKISARNKLALATNHKRRYPHSPKCHPIVKKLTKRSFELVRCPNKYSMVSLVPHGRSEFSFSSSAVTSKWGWREIHV